MSTSEQGIMSDRASEPPTEKKPLKRGSRACTNCRRLKKICSSEEPCARCVKAGVACEYDRPARTVLSDDGMDRLVAIESTLARLTETIQHINNNVTQLLVHQQTQVFGSHASVAASLPTPTFFATPAMPDLPQPVASTSSSTGLLEATSLIPRQHHILPPTNVSAGSDFILHETHISPAREETMDVESFESSLHAPIEALARAAAAASQFLPHDENRLAEESQLAEHGSGLHGFGVDDREGSSGNFTDDDTRPRKRTRIAFLPTKTSSLEQHDVVSKGLVTEVQARNWFNLFSTKLQPYCNIINPVFDTYDKIRRHSHVLFNTILYLAARTENGANPPSPTLIAVAEETRTYAQSLIFETQPPVDVIQALILMAVWHDEPYMLSGYALRMAASSRLEMTFAQFDAHGWDKTDAKAHLLITRLRCWLYLVYVDFKHSASTGRLILISPSDIETVEKNADKIFLSPLSTADDNRTVANLKLTILHRKILRSSPPVLQSPLWDPSEHVEYLRTLQGVVQKWFDSYDQALAAHYPGDFNWSRRSQFRILCDGKLFLSCLVFKKSLLERSPHPAVVQIAHEAFENARASYQTVLQSAIYTDSLQFCGFLTRVDLSFACLTALKLLALYPDLAEADEIVGEVRRVADLMAGCSGSQRFSMAVRVAADHFLAKTGPSRGEPSSSIHPLFTLQELSNTQQAFGNNALLPGEVEIDWTSLASSFVDTSDLLNGDWMPYSNLADNWLDDFT